MPSCTEHSYGPHLCGGLDTRMSHSATPSGAWWKVTLEFRDFPASQVHGNRQPPPEVGPMAACRVPAGPALQPAEQAGTVAMPGRPSGPARVLAKPMQHGPREPVSLGRGSLPHVLRSPRAMRSLCGKITQLSPPSFRWYQETQ